MKSRVPSLTRLSLLLCLLLVGLAVPRQSAWANPFFYIQTDDQAVVGARKFLPLFMNTDDSTVTAAQAVLNFSSAYLKGSSISVLGSRCSFWAPADPALGFGNTVAPYFTGGNKAVIACGFSNPGYKTSGGASLIATIVLTPEASGSTSLTFSNTKFHYIASTIPSGASPNFDLTVYPSTESAVAAQPTPTPTPPITPPDTISVVSEPSDTLSASDINFLEVGQSSGSGSSPGSTPGLSEGVTLEAVEDDDSIPPVPPLTPRDRPTPFVFNPATSRDDPDNQGEVLSVSSLRELLIPGKSSADKTVVLINFVSTLTFITLLAIALWRMITLSRMSKVKYQHMQDVLTGELSTLQSKVGGLSGKKNNEELESEIKRSFEALVSKVQSNESSSDK